MQTLNFDTDGNDKSDNSEKDSSKSEKNDDEIWKDNVKGDIYKWY